jgi:hypothetical protein
MQKRRGGIGTQIILTIAEYEALLGKHVRQGLSEREINESDLNCCGRELEKEGRGEAAGGL